MRKTNLAGAVALATLAASFMPWGSLTGPITTPGPLRGTVHTFPLTGWNGSLLVPFWVDVLAAIAAAALLGVDRNRAAMLLAMVVVAHLTFAGAFLVLNEGSSVGPGLVTTVLAVGVLAFQALGTVRTRTS